MIVISQKIVSKAEGRVRRLSSVLPSAEARRLAAVLGKEPNLVELILEESRAVLRAEGGVLITETRHGFVCANAGVDSSNLPEPDTACLLPEDPDASARRITRPRLAGPPSAGPTPLGGDRQRQLRARLAPGPGRGRDRLRRDRPTRRLARPRTTPAGASSRRP